MSTDQTVLQRVIFPEHGDPQALPLFLDPETWSWAYIPDDEQDQLAKIRGVFTEGHNKLATRLTNKTGLSWLRGRRGIELPSFKTVSFASYFNAFPASYWNAWTNLDGVRLRVRTNGPGRILVFRSNARGVIQRIDSAEVTGETTTEFELSFASFLDGGWLWFDLVAGDAPFELVQADWLAPEGAAPRVHGTATVSITTLNRGDYCTTLLREIGEDKTVLASLDRVLVVDQGSEKIRENAGYAAAEQSLEGKLRLIEQANLGGSGGFSRGMLETSRAGESDYIVLLDDDVEIEPESLLRALTFANFCVEPTIVGGHMFDMYDKAKLHAYAEGIHWSPFMWGPFTPGRHDFGESNLRQTAWLHRRFDVDYNGWWMSLIPVSVINEIGASLPVFIKWDDAEYSLRAREHGVATVSLPGAAVWHVSWVDKDDSHDWQAFFHARNRLVAALLHSPEPRGGRLSRSNLAGDVKNLLTMDYYTVAMRHEAIRNVLEGPEQLHTDMRDRLARVRAMAEGFTEAKVIRDTTQIPHFPAREIMAVTTGRSNPGPHGFAFARWMWSQVFRHAFRAPAAGADSRPQAHLSFQDARWFEVPNYDSVLVSNAEGSGATLHARRPPMFRKLLRDSIRLNRAYRRRWTELSGEYRQALPGITSLERWEQSLFPDQQ
ncbi:glycosyltransferase family 2 protein [Agromyces fucosus]|uniref:Glycosyltransferase family 2 protein n=1 Tax=Agromyces fucosus TaxID=41985 RepID=A0A4Q2JWX0_9MICO|nr:glycosyltransferase [Agromyces fucosus]RXZ51020.1 glycosyltransferase family 2 protein [Agromyces fucosus]